MEHIEKHVVEDLQVAVGLAAMVDVVGAVTTFAAIEAPAVIDRADTKPTAIGSAPGFPIRDLFTCVLCYFSAALKPHLRETTLAFNG